MGFQFQVVLNDPADLGGTQDANLVADLNQALASWSNYITGPGTLVVQLNFQDITNNSFDQLASGSFVDSIYAGQLGARSLYTPSSIYELTTGQHIPGDSYDISVTLNAAKLDQLYASPDPSLPYVVPSTQIDAVSLLTHEIGHGLGFAGFTTTDGTLGGAETLWDSYLRSGPDGSETFVGPNAIAAYGAPVPITTLTNTEGYAHVANSFSEPLGQDLMNGIGFDPGRTYGISTVDLAILKDVGVPVDANTIGSGNPPVFRFYDSSDGGHFFTASPAEVQTIMARNPAYRYEGPSFDSIGANSTAAASPLFRFYNTVNHEHFFTISAAERDHILANNPALSYEGPAFNESAGAQPGFVPVYRFFDTANGSHFFTSSQSEQQSILANLPAFHYEGVGFYAPGSSSTAIA